MPGFGNYLKGLRGGKSLRELAEKTGISHTHLMNLEKEKKRPSTKCLKVLSDYHRVPYSRLMVLSGLITKDDINQMAIELLNGSINEEDE